MLTASFERQLIGVVMDGIGLQTATERFVDQMAAVDRLEAVRCQPLLPIPQGAGDAEQIPAAHQMRPQRCS